MLWYGVANFNKLWRNRVESLGWWLACSEEKWWNVYFRIRFNWTQVYAVFTRISNSSVNIWATFWRSFATLSITEREKKKQALGVGTIQWKLWSIFIADRLLYKQWKIYYFIEHTHAIKSILNSALIYFNQLKWHLDNQQNHIFATSLYLDFLSFALFVLLASIYYYDLSFIMFV